MVDNQSHRSRVLTFRLVERIMPRDRQLFKEKASIFTLGEVKTNVLLNHSRSSFAFVRRSSDKHPFALKLHLKFRFRHFFDMYIVKTTGTGLLTGLINPIGILCLVDLVIHVCRGNEVKFYDYRVTGVTIGDVDMYSLFARQRSSLAIGHYTGTRYPLLFKLDLRFGNVEFFQILLGPLLLPSPLRTMMYAQLAIRLFLGERVGFYRIQENVSDRREPDANDMDEDDYDLNAWSFLLDKYDDLLQLAIVGYDLYHPRLLFTGTDQRDYPP